MMTKGSTSGSACKHSLRTNARQKLNGITTVLLCDRGTGATLGKAIQLQEKRKQRFQKNTKLRRVEKDIRDVWVRTQRRSPAIPNASRSTADGVLMQASPACVEISCMRVMIRSSSVAAKAEAQASWTDDSLRTWPRTWPRPWSRPASPRWPSAHAPIHCTWGTGIGRRFAFEP